MSRSFDRASARSSLLPFIAGGIALSRVSTARASVPFGSHCLGVQFGALSLGAQVWALSLGAKFGCQVWVLSLGTEFGC